MDYLPAGLVAGVMILMLCTCGCMDISPFQPPETQPPVTTPRLPPTLFPTAPPRVGPAGTTWYLVTLEDNNTRKDVLPGTVITAFFNGLNTVSGSSGCNQYTASYTSNQDKLVVGPPASTKMFCDSPPGILEQEGLYLSTIQMAASYSVSGDLLKVNDSTGKTVLSYTSVPRGSPVNPPLLGTTWYLESYVDASGTTWTPGRLTIVSLVLADDGNAYGSTGCNNYLGSYQVSGDTISINGLKKTPLYCGIAGVMEVEAAYITLLPEMSRYSISDGNLLLSDPATRTSLLFDTKPNLP